MFRALKSVQLTQARGLFRPPSNIPYGGIHRTDGEQVKKGDLLVVQRKLNYHPGRNVSNCMVFMFRFIYLIMFIEISLFQVFCVFDRGQLLLKSDCDGTVMITKEPVDLDLGLEQVEKNYKNRVTENLEKLHFHVIQRPMSQSFRRISQE